MNFAQLRAFLVVAERRGVSRATEELALTQSAISRQIQSLERALRAKLFVRHGHSLILTDAGRILLEHGRRILRAVGEAQDALDGLRGLRRGHLRIGAASTIGTYLLPEPLGAFKRLFPGIEVTLEIANKAETLRRLLAQEIDIGFVGPPIRAAALVAAEYLTDELVLITAPGHPLAGSPSVTAPDLANEVFIMRERGSGTREIMEEELVRSGVEIKKVMELGSTEAIKQAVAANLGVSLVSRYAISLEILTGRLCSAIVSDLRLTRQLYAVYHEQGPLTWAASAFLDFLRSGATRRPAVTPATAPLPRARPGARRTARRLPVSEKRA
jgi:DNA-binding transcriptional LysR family regulator